jgi:hypothetical protein
MTRVRFASTHWGKLYHSLAQPSGFSLINPFRGLHANQHFHIHPHPLCFICGQGTNAPTPAPMLSGPNDKAPDAPAPATLSSDHVCDVMNSPPPAKIPPHWWQYQILFSNPLPKVSQQFLIVFPPGTLFDPDDLAQPPSPSTPFDFPFDPTSDQALAGMLLPDTPTNMDSVTHVVGLHTSVDSLVID